MLSSLFATLLYVNVCVGHVKSKIHLACKAKILTSPMFEGHASVLDVRSGKASRKENGCQYQVISFAALHLLPKSKMNTSVKVVH